MKENSLGKVIVKACVGASGYKLLPCPDHTIRTNMYYCRSYTSHSSGGLLNDGLTAFPTNNSGGVVAGYDLIPTVYVLFKS